MFRAIDDLDPSVWGPFGGFDLLMACMVVTLIRAGSSEQVLGTVRQDRSWVHFCMRREGPGAWEEGILSVPGTQ